MNAAADIAPCGVSPARPCTTRRSGPMKVNAAAPGCAQPLAQPDTCMVNEPSRNGLAACGIDGATWRVESMADRQAGAPAQANTYRRASSARTTNPAAAAESVNSFVAAAATPMVRSARPGAGCIEAAPQRAAACANRLSTVASVYP